MNRLLAQVTAPRSRAPAAVAAADTYRMFVSDLVVQAGIGVYDHEHGRTQRVRVNLDAQVAAPGKAPTDIAEVVSYERFVDAVRSVAEAGHTTLVEGMAEAIADLCLADRRVRSIRVRVEKLDVFPDAAAVGIEIERHRPD